MESLSKSPSESLRGEVLVGVPVEVLFGVPQKALVGEVPVGVPSKSPLESLGRLS